MNFYNRTADRSLSTIAGRGVRLVSPPIASTSAGGTIPSQDVVTVITRSIFSRAGSTCSAHVASVAIFGSGPSGTVPPTQSFILVPQSSDAANQQIYTLQNAVTGNYLRFTDDCSISGGAPTYYAIFDNPTIPPPPDQNPINWFRVTQTPNENNYTFESLARPGTYLGKLVVTEIEPDVFFTALSLVNTNAGFSLIE